MLFVISRIVHVCDYLIIRVVKNTVFSVMNTLQISINRWIVLCKQTIIYKEMSDSCVSVVILSLCMTLYNITLGIVNVPLMYLIQSSSCPSSFLSLFLN